MFAQLSDLIVTILRNQLRTKFTLYEDQIVCARPSKEDNDAMIGVYLYDIVNIDHVQNHEPYFISEDKKEKRAKVVELSYMIYVNTNVSMKSISLSNEMQLLEEILRIFYQHPSVEVNGIKVTLSFEDIALNEKIHLWQTLDMVYQNALYIRAAPVLVRSLQEEVLKRVEKREMKVEGINHV